MPQLYEDVPTSTTLTDSLAPLLARDDANKSCFEGTTFPSSGLAIGMLCFRSDQLKLYELRDLTGTGGGPTWVMLFDLTKTALAQEDGDARYKAIGTQPTAAQVSYADTSPNLGASTAQAAIDAVKAIADAAFATWVAVKAVIPTTSNAYGSLTVSNGGTPSGGIDGDCWETY